MGANKNHRRFPGFGPLTSHKVAGMSSPRCPLPKHGTVSVESCTPSRGRNGCFFEECHPHRILGCPSCTRLWLPSWRAAWPPSCGLVPQPEHGVTPLLEAAVAAWSSGLLALCGPQSWIPPQQRLGDACDPPGRPRRVQMGP